MNASASHPQGSHAPGTLQTNALGVLEIASLGVAIAISGNFVGWNYGLPSGGWGGMFCAAVLMATLYVGLTQVVGELAAALPMAGGFDGYVSRAFGERLGYGAGMSLLVGLGIGAGLAATFIAAYLQSLTGWGGWPVKILLIAAVILLQARGAHDSARVTLLAGAVAVLVLVGFCLISLQHFRAAQLFTALPGGAVTLFPTGLASIFLSVPFALFFFCGVEQAALAAPEARNVSRTIPRALGTAVVTALSVGFAVFILATGSAGVETLIKTDDPLYTAIQSVAGHGTTTVAAYAVSVGAMVSILATFFSLSYAASRQSYSLARAGALPSLFARTNSRHAPHWSLLLLAVLCVVGAAFDPNVVTVVFVFLLNVTYQLTLAAFVFLRRQESGLARPFRARGGSVTAIITACLSLVVIASCVQQQRRATLIAAGVVLFYIATTSVLRRRSAAASVTVDA
jgi:ethanolamine permease